MKLRKTTAYYSLFFGSITKYLTPPRYFLFSLSLHSIISSGTIIGTYPWPKKHSWENVRLKI